MIISPLTLSQLKNETYLHIISKLIILITHRALVEDGVIYWRTFTAESSIFVMTDINLRKGTLHSSAFAHQTTNFCDEFTCDCDMFNKTNQSLDCFHIQFLKEEVKPNYELCFKNFSENDSILERKLKNSRQCTNDPVVILCSSVIKRISVVPRDYGASPAVVKLDSNRLTCLNGLCRARKANTRKVIGINTPGACPHFSTLSEHQQIWDHLLPMETNVSTDKL